MASQVPMTRSVSFLRILFPFLVLIGFFQLADRFLAPNVAPIVAFVSFFALLFGLRETVSKHHRRGIRKMKRGDFDGAKIDFENSLKFFQENEWLDKGRSIFAMSAGNMCFKEMALVNIAFAHTQSGRGDLAIETYEKTLALYPKNIIASSALKMLRSVQGETTTPAEDS
jgi:tetratricopeptide (TPR) repeat protein